jgi:hypothetical protein
VIGKQQQQPKTTIMTDQIEAVKNLITANLGTKPRTPQLDAARGYLTSALTNMQGHVAELGRLCAQRAEELVAHQAKLQELQARVEVDKTAEVQSPKSKVQSPAAKV